MTWLVLIALALAFIAAQRFTGFPAQRLSDYASTGPAFDPKIHLNGPILCEGMIYGPFGRVTSRFVADMHGTWDGTKATLTEHFRYDTGTTQDREWQLSLFPNGSLSATAADLVGSGEGHSAGPACQMRYRLRLAQSAGGHVLNVVDWMYLMPNGTILNRSQFFKFGFKVAELIATMRPLAATQAQDTHPQSQAAA